MLKWLNTGFLNQWYGKRQYTYGEILEKYGNRIIGSNPTDPYLIFYDDALIGYIQTYRISDHPNYNKYVQADENTAGLDLFIGESDYINKGFGAALLAKFLKEVVFFTKEIAKCIIGPEPENKAAIRYYEKVGFQHFKTIFNPDELEQEFLMIINREELGEW